MRRRSPRAHAQRQQAPPRAPDLDDAHDFSPPTTTDTAEHHDAAGVRSTTGSRLGVPQQTAPARFMKTPVGFYDRITTDSSLGQTTINLSLRLYTELRRRFTNFYTGYGTPKREALAAAIQTSLRSLDRALDALRKHGGIRTEKLRDGRGHVCGMEIWVLNENSADPDNLTVPTDSQDESKLPPRAVSKNLKKNAKLPPVAVRPAEPNCHREPSLTATGGSAFLSTFQDLSNDQDLDPGDRHDLRTDQDPVVVVKAERQQQHDDDKPPDDDTGPPPDPTVQEALQAFYALWTSLHNRQPTTNAPRTSGTWPRLSRRHRRPTSSSSTSSRVTCSGRGTSSSSASTIPSACWR